MRKDGSSLKSHVEGASLSASTCTAQVSQQECVYDDTSHTSLLPISSLPRSHFDASCLSQQYSGGD